MLMLMLLLWQKCVDRTGELGQTGSSQDFGKRPDKLSWHGEKSRGTACDKSCAVNSVLVAPCSQSPRGPERTRDMIMVLLSPLLVHCLPEFVDHIAWRMRYQTLNYDPAAKLV